ncbi:inward rectifier K channel (IRK-C) family protein [Phytophthora palmivora]|uniref:Inward rectifier K channel (IRK-C) family protein n=1 Tax=Phytophthora palmivora TaxID=4796 RepID=A0A2P4Y2V6_9STRA|nr:inward rectifier K channel (IRK-C) family protein [Phytophthora palmivora]
MLSSRSGSWDGQSTTADNDVSDHPHPPVSFSKKSGPKKFGMGLEPFNRLELNEYQKAHQSKLKQLIGEV